MVEKGRVPEESTHPPPCAMGAPVISMVPWPPPSSTATSPCLAGLALHAIPLLALSFARIGNAQQVQPPIKLTTPNYTFYHSTDLLLQEVRALAQRHSSFVEVEEQALSREGYSATLTAVHVKLGSWGHERPSIHRRLSPWGSTLHQAAQIRALLVFGQHGREPVTSEIGLRLLKLLTGEVAPRWEKGTPTGKRNKSGVGVGVGNGPSLRQNWHRRDMRDEGSGVNGHGRSDSFGASSADSGPSLRRKWRLWGVRDEGSGDLAWGTSGSFKAWSADTMSDEGGAGNGVTLRGLLDSLPPTQVTIVPMGNVNGRRLFEGGQLCDRRNGRGVDLNRNWALHFGVKEKDYDPQEEFPGTAPFSEPEAELMRRLSERLKPQLWVNVHSGMEALFMPFDHRQGGLDPSELAAMRHLAGFVNARFCGSRCVLGSGGGSVGYFAHGTATDWVYGTLRTPLAFTFEVYGDSSAHPQDCFRAFNPTTSKSFFEVVATWSEALGSLLTELPETLARLPPKPPLLNISLVSAGTSRRISGQGLGRVNVSSHVGSLLFVMVLLLSMFCFCIRVFCRAGASAPVLSQKHPKQSMKKT